MRASAAAAGSDWDGHLLLLHDTEAERLAGLTAWVCRGLERDEKVIYAETPDLPPAQSFLGVLAGRGVDVAAATAEGRLAVLPLAEFYPPDGQVTVIERALAEGFGRVRMSAEARAALTFLPERAYTGFEATMDELCRTRPVSAMCQYDRRTTTGARLRQAVAIHLVGVRQGRLRTSPDGQGIALTGQIDVANADTLAATLQAATNTATRVVWLDLEALEFLDAAACRALTVATRRFRERGGQVLLVAPQPAVEQTLRLLDLDQLPGLDVIGGGP
jgi:anti-anti-sigma factor